METPREKKKDVLNKTNVLCTQRVYGVFLFAALLWASCSQGSADLTYQKPVSPYFSYNSSFSDDIAGWKASFLVFPPFAQDSLAQSFTFKHAAVSNSANLSKKVLKIACNYHNNRAVMFIWQKFKGFRPNTRYRLLLALQAALSPDTLRLTDGKSAVGFPSSSLKNEVSFNVGLLNDTFQSRVFNFSDVLEKNRDYQVSYTDRAAYAETAKHLHALKPASKSKFSGLTFFEHSSSGKTIVGRSNARGELWVVIGVASSFNGHLGVRYSQIQLFINPLSGQP